MWATNSFKLSWVVGSFLLAMFGWCLRCPGRSIILLSIAVVRGRVEVILHAWQIPSPGPVLFQVLGMLGTMCPGRVTKGWPTLSISRYSFAERVSGRAEAVAGTGNSILQSSVRSAAQPAQEWESLVEDGTLPRILAQFTILFLACLPLDMLVGG